MTHAKVLYEKCENLADASSGRRYDSLRPECVKRNSYLLANGPIWRQEHIKINAYASPHRRVGQVQNSLENEVVFIESSR